MNLEDPFLSFNDENNLYDKSIFGELEFYIK